MEMVMGKKIFKHRVRVPYAHVDRMGFVYYANYLVYFEMARSELLRETGTPYPEMEARGVILPVVEAVCRYVKPAHFDDLLEIQTRCSGINGVRVTLEYSIVRIEGRDAGDGIVEGHTVHVCMSPEGKVLKPAGELTALV